MKPSELSNELRRIAAAIDNSKKPSKDLVAQAIKKLVAAIDPARIDRMVQQDERVEDMLSLEEEKIKEAIAGLEKALESLGQAKQSEKAA